MNQPLSPSSKEELAVCHKDKAFTCLIPNPIASGECLTCFLTKDDTAKSKKKGVQKSVLLPQEMWDRLEDLADADYCSVSQVIRIILRDNLDVSRDVV